MLHVKYFIVLIIVEPKLGYTALCQSQCHLTKESIFLLHDLSLQPMVNHMAVISFLLLLLNSTNDVVTASYFSWLNWANRMIMPNVAPSPFQCLFPWPWQFIVNSHCHFLDKTHQKKGKWTKALQTKAIWKVAQQTWANYFGVYICKM